EVAAWPSEARHQLIPDRIAHRRRHDRDRRRCVASGTRAGRRSRQDEVDLETHQLTRQRREPLDVAARRSQLEDEVLTLDITALPESPAKGIEPLSPFGRLERARGQVAD